MGDRKEIVDMIINVLQVMTLREGQLLSKLRTYVTTNLFISTEFMKSFFSVFIIVFLWIRHSLHELKLCDIVVTGSYFII